MLSNSSHLMLAVDPPSRINGANANSMRFPRVMCAECNNARSQPFDRAYDQFVSFIHEDPDFFRSRASFNLSEILGSNKGVSMDLARYYMKNIACRIAERGFEVPAEIIDFMDGEPSMPHGVLVLFKDFSLFDQFRRLGDSGHSKFANSMCAPAVPSEGMLVEFSAEIKDGPVGAVFWWSRETPLGITFAARDLVYLRDRRELPYHDLHRVEWDRAEALSALRLSKVPSSNTQTQDAATLS